MEEAVEKLSLSYDLCSKIVLGKLFDVKLQDINVPNDLNVTASGTAEMPLNNPSQNNAIRKALTQSFTLIQGPPGTGKTLTAIKIAYWFAKLNEKSSEGRVKKQIMFCGPSNSSVDVAMNFMISYLGSDCLKIVRVYSEMTERQLFPIPRDCNSEKYSNNRMPNLAGKDHVNKDKVLHFLIRKPCNSYSKKINNYDDIFKRNAKTPEKVSQDDIDKYKKLIYEASVEEIRKHDIIFCTCAVSASGRIKEGAKVAQVIVDECAMCIEPEVFIPLVSFKPQQIVLVGDHKQLRPIITYKKAQTLGMDKSLFERWAELIDDTFLNKNLFVMLDEQYRMHPQICEFPSTKFYGGKLKSSSPKVKVGENIVTRMPGWQEIKLVPIWKEKDKPVVFCHVEGAEKSEAVSTSEGKEQSKSNFAEQDHVVRIFSTLVNEYGVAQNSIAVLSQYKAQCCEIVKKMDSFGFNMENIHVDTVVASQGTEWDYVILSLVRSLMEDEIEKRPSIGWLQKHLGFIIDWNQINVALTRAKRGLIIIGNKNLLKVDDMWRALLNMYENDGCVLDADDFPWKKKAGVYTAQEDIPRIREKFKFKRVDASRIYGDQSNRVLKPPTDYDPNLHPEIKRQAPKQRPKVPMQNRMN